MKNASEIILEQTKEFNRICAIIAMVPDGIEIESYVTPTDVYVGKVVSFDRMIEMLKEFRIHNSCAHRRGSYSLGSKWNSKKGENVEHLRVCYSLGAIENLEKYSCPKVNFMVRSPKASLKRLGVACKIQTVKHAAEMVEASEARQIVCPVSA